MISSKQYFLRLTLKNSFDRRILVLRHFDCLPMLTNIKRNNIKKLVTIEFHQVYTVFNVDFSYRIFVLFPFHIPHLILCVKQYSPTFDVTVFTFWKKVMNVYQQSSFRIVHCVVVEYRIPFVCVRSFTRSLLYIQSQTHSSDVTLNTRMTFNIWKTADSNIDSHLLVESIDFCELFIIFIKNKPKPECRGMR